MYPGKTRIRELQTRFNVKNGQVSAMPRYTNLNWYLGHSFKPTTFGNMEWFCFGDVENADLERLRKLLEMNEKLVLGWKDLSHDTGDDDPQLDEGNKVWLYIISFGVMLDKREGWRPGEVFTLDVADLPVWQKIITTGGAV